MMKNEFTYDWNIPKIYLPLTTGYTTMHAHHEETPTSNHAYTHEFEKLLLEAVDEGLSSLGDSPKQAIYHYLENTFKVRKEDIPRKIHEFADGIEKIFGDGARLIEVQIMKQLYKKVGDVFEYDPIKSELHFTEYVEAAEFSIKKQTVNAHTNLEP